MEDSRIKYRIPNIIRIAVTVFNLVLIQWMNVTYPIIYYTAFIHIFFAILWLFLIESRIFIDSQYTWSGYIPGFMDITSSTIIILLTGNIHSYLLVGYFIISSISSIRVGDQFGRNITIFCCLQFVGMGLGVYLGILPGINMFAHSVTDITLASLLISNFWMGVGLFMIHKIIFTAVQQNTGLREKAEHEKEISQKLLTEMKRDLNFAKRIQTNILPSNLNQFNKLKVDLFYLPLNEVGGDFYDIIQLSDNSYRVVLADATGHGVQASLITMLIKSEFSNIQQFNLSPRETIQNLNRVFFAKYRSLNSFFTLFIADIDLESRTLKYCSGGHPDQYISQKGELITLAKTGKLLGILPNETYLEDECKMEKGFQLILFSDGLYEEFNESRQEFGDERLKIFLQKNQNMYLSSLTEGLIQAMRNWVGNAKLQDDVTILILEEN